jgi:transposase-like protein
MIATGSCASAIPETRAVPIPTTPLTRPGNDIVSRLEARSAWVSPIVIRNDNPDVWRSPGKAVEKIKAREAIKRVKQHTPIDPAPIIAAYTAGASINAVAKTLKHSAGTVAKVLRSNGIPIVNRRKGGRSTIPATTKAAVIAAIRDGATNTRAARDNQISITTVKKIWRESGEVRTVEAQREWAVTPTQRAEIITAYQGGMTIPDIAKRMHLAKSTTRRMLTLAGIPLRDDRAGRPREGQRIPKAVRDQVIRLYVDHQLTIQQAADRVGISGTAAARIVKHAGVSRPIGQAQRGKAGIDRARELRDLLAANGITGRDVRLWANQAGRHCPGRGIPPRHLIEDYLLTRTTTQEGTA